MVERWEYAPRKKGSLTKSVSMILTEQEQLNSVTWSSLIMYISFSGVMGMECLL